MVAYSCPFGILNAKQTNLYCLENQNLQFLLHIYEICPAYANCYNTFTWCFVYTILTQEKGKMTGLTNNHSQVYTHGDESVSTNE